MSAKVKALFFAANPRDTTALELGKELRAINKAIRAGEYRQLEIIPAFATRTSDLQPALNRHLPHIVHFSGHGSSIGQILTEDPQGNTRPINPPALKKLFETPRNNNVRLVFLNACFSRVQAQAIVEVVDCAIGMNTAIADSSAIIFAQAVYGALADGLSVEEAFRQGECRLAFDDIVNQNVPELLARHGVDPKQIYFVSQNHRHAKIIVPLKAKKQQPDLTRSWTNPTGRSYLSYHRSQVEEARLLIAAQRDRGIPTYHDLNELENDQPERVIKRTLADSGTASALLWLTPQMSSDSRRKTEIASILDRANRDREDSFLLYPLLGGGLDFRRLKSILEVKEFDELQEWNPRTVKHEPIGRTESASIARAILKDRLAVIHRTLPAGEPLRMQFFTRPSPSLAPGTALLIDWTHRFNGPVAQEANWKEFLLPALEDIADAVHTQAFERIVEMSGLVSIAAATALGCFFLAPRGLNVSWRQSTRGRDDQFWSIDVPRQPSGFRAEVIPIDSRAKDIAVLVSVSASVDLAFNCTRDHLPPLQAIVRVNKPGSHRAETLNAGQASDVAQTVVDGIRRARNEYRQLGCVHLFMAVPVGLAMMIGQLMNTFKSIQTYEHLPDDRVGNYRRAALLHPSN